MSTSRSYGWLCARPGGRDYRLEDRVTLIDQERACGGNWPD